MGKGKYNIFSILSIIFAFLFFPLGIIFGIVSLVQIKKTGEKGKGLAIASIILGAIFLVIAFITFETVVGTWIIARDSSQSWIMARGSS